MSDYWPQFHFDPKHPPASHPGEIETCPICRPGQTIIDTEEATK